jgi:hypothetical protein
MPNTIQGAPRHARSKNKTKQSLEAQHSILVFFVALMQNYRPYIEHSWSKLKHTTRRTATEIGSHELWTKLAGFLGKDHTELCPACSLGFKDKYLLKLTSNFIRG